MNTKNPKQSVRGGANRSKRYRRIMWLSLAAMIGLSLVLPTLTMVLSQIGDANAQAVAETNPRADIWRAVREGAPGYSAVRGDGANVLIQNGGQNWRQLRNGPVATYGAWAMLVMICLISIFFAIRGRIRIDEPSSGRRIARWSPFERAIHWYTAILFVVLTVTGLSMLFGRAVLIPMFGKSANAAWAAFSIEVHNLAGPAFAIGIVLMIALWIQHNIPSMTDVRWFKAGGGMFGRAHPDAGFANGGEKVWFWIVAIIGGIGVVATGMMLNFQPWFPFLTRDLIQDYHLIHLVSAFIWIVVWMGHAYIGTVGSQGSIDGMWKGHVDEAWAKQHHNLWYEDVKQRGN